MFYQPTTEGLAVSFFDWLDDARAIAAGRWDNCRAASRERAANGGLSPLALFEGYCLLENESTAETIREELIAQMSCEAFVSYTVDWMLDYFDCRAMKELQVPGWEGFYENESTGNRAV